MDSINRISLLDWTNFSLWKGEVELALLILSCDHAIRKSAPTLPTTEGDYDNAFYWRVKEFESDTYMWERSNRLSLKIMKKRISDDVRGVIPDTDNAKQFLASLEELLKDQRNNYEKFFALRRKRKLNLEKQELKRSRAEAEHSFESLRCRFCMTIGHLQKDYDGFKDWLTKRVIIKF